VSARPVIFLSDFGYADEFAGVCRAVIERLAPGTSVVDLTHGIPPGDVRRGALALEAALHYGPPAVYLAVVDPGVGTTRRAVAVRAGKTHLVGPDNGLLAPAIARLGGASDAVEITRTPVRLEPTSNTFHGRDVFAPVAAELARGGNLEGLGEVLDQNDLAPLELPGPATTPGRLTAHVLYSDGFGNLVLDANRSDLEAAGLLAASNLAITAGGRSETANPGVTFADAGEGLVLYDDSVGRLGLACDGDSAERQLGVARDDEILIEAEA
jgi:S-adenosyl-L-methionine hydrolase (adenosine-forming)